jgi:hypothetical protein
MSDQVPQQGSERPVIDGSNLINVGGGGGGVTSINGDAAAAQTLVSGGGITIVDGGGGVHTFAVPSPLPVPPFAPGQAGIVTDPGASPAASYLRADNTFATLPAALASINGDPTAAQTLVGSGCSIIDTGGGGHTISIDFPDFVLGVGINLDLQAAATYTLFTVPGGFSGAIITKVVMVLVAGNPNISADGQFTLNSVATAGINDYRAAESTSSFNPLTFNQEAILFPGDIDNISPSPLYPPGDSFQLVSAGGTDPATFMVFVFGFLIS